MYQTIADLQAAALSALLHHQLHSESESVTFAEHSYVVIPRLGRRLQRQSPVSHTAASLPQQLLCCQQSHLSGIFHCQQDTLHLPCQAQEVQLETQIYLGQGKLHASYVSHLMLTWLGHPLPIAVTTPHFCPPTIYTKAVQANLVLSMLELAYITARPLLLFVYTLASSVHCRQGA